MARATELDICFDPLWRKQAGIRQPAALERLTGRFPATTKRWVSVTENIVQIFDCSLTHVVNEYVRNRLARLTVDFNVTPQLLGGFLSFLAGATAAPTGATVNAVQTWTIANATGGFYLATFNFDGLAVQTAPIAYNASAPAVENAINAAILSAGYYGSGNATVGKAGAVWTVTFGNMLGAAAITAPIFDVSNLTGAGASVTLETTAPGSQRAHAISLMAGFAVPLMTLVVMFRDLPDTAVIFRDIGVNSLRVTFGRDGTVTATAELIGSADLQPATGFVPGDCVPQDTVRPTDCRLLVDGVVQDGLVEGEVTIAQNLMVDDDAWTTASPDIDRLERGDTRTFTQTFAIYGVPSPNVQLWADAIARRDRNVTLRIGRPGNNVLYNSPKATIRRNGDGIGLTGQARRSTLTLGADPKFDEASPANTEMNFIANVPMATQYCVV